MNVRIGVLVLCVVSVALSIGACKKSMSGAADWTNYGRTNDEQRFSPLQQINEQSIGQLGLLWSRELGTTRGLEATPLVSNGIIYTTGEWSTAYALDAKTGEILWTFDPKVPRALARTICCDVVNRGVALYKGKIFLGTLDRRLIAFDARSGTPVWDVVTTDQTKPYAITGAPRIAKGLVLIGNANGITWASGIDPKSGRPIESTTAYNGLQPVLVSPDPGGAHNWYPMAFHSGTGLVYVPAREGVFALHVPNKHWKYNAKTDNIGMDSRYEGPLLKQSEAVPAPIGKLIAWNPVEQRKIWEVTDPVLESGGVLATAGNLVFQGRADGMFCAYRATDGRKLWEFNAGTGIMAPPVTYLINGTQYLTLVVGWGGSAGLLNIPGHGPIKPGFGRVLTFAIGANAKFEGSFFRAPRPTLARYSYEFVLGDRTRRLTPLHGALFLLPWLRCHIGF